MKKHEEGLEPLEEEVEENPRGDDHGMCWKSPNMKQKKKKHSSGKQKAKKRKKKKKVHRDKEPKKKPPQPVNIPRKPSATNPVYIKQELLSSSCRVKLTESDLVDLETAGPDISEQEMELVKFPGWREPLCALLTTRNLSGFVTDRAVDMRLVSSGITGVYKKGGIDLTDLESYIKPYSAHHDDDNHVKFEGTLADFLDNLSLSGSETDSSDYFCKVEGDSSKGEEAVDDMFEKTLALYEDKSLSYEE